ncbi:MAG: phage tail tape measure protein [Proteobacteria bacterium]|nr:phage tail tape measure protein [Pseudomonadota bacterium]
MVDKLRLEVVLAAIDKATGPLKAIASGSKATAGALTQTERALRELQKQQRTLDGFDKQRAAMGEARNKLRVLQQQLQAMQAAGQASAKEMKAQEKAVAQASKAYDEQRATVLRLRQQLTHMGMGNASAAQARLAGDIQRTNTQIDAQRQKMQQQQQVEQRLHALREKHGADMARLGMRGAMAAGVGMAGQRLGGALGKPVQAFADAEEAQTQLKISFMQADGSVVPEYQQILDKAEELGDRLPGTTADFIRMMTVLRQEGMSAKAVLGGLGDAAANLGVLLGTGPEEAAAKMAKMQDSLRATENEMGEVADLMQRAKYLGADMSFMQSAIGNAAPVMDIMKTQGAEAMRMLAPMAVMMNQAGMEDGGSVGNAVRKIYDRAMNSKKVAKANAAMKAAGTGARLDFTDGKGEFGGLEKLFNQLSKLRALSTVDRGLVMNALWGDDAETNRVLTKWINDNLDGYSQTVEKMKAQADLQKRVNEQLGTLKAVADAAAGSYSNLLKELGASIAPELKALLNGLGALARAVGTWAKENPTVTKALMLLAAGAAALMVGVGALGVALVSVLGPLALLRFLSARFGLGLLATQVGAAGAGGAAGRLAGVLGRVRGAWAALRQLGMAGVFKAMGAAMASPTAWLGVLKGGLGLLWRMLTAFARANPIAALLLGLIGLFAGLYAHWDKIKEYFNAGEWWSMAKEIWAAIEWGLNAATMGVYELLKSMAMTALGAVWDGIKSFTGFGSGDGEGGTRKVAAAAALATAAGAAGAAPLPATPVPVAMAPVQASSAARAPGAMGSGTYNITVNGAPGMDERTLARTVAQELDKRERAGRSRLLSQLSDID